MMYPPPPKTIEDPKKKTNQTVRQGRGQEIEPDLKLRTWTSKTIKKTVTAQKLFIVVYPQNKGPKF